VRGDELAAGLLIAFDAHLAVEDSDKRDELLIIMFDEQNLTFADLEFGSARHFHRVLANGAAKDADRVGAARITLESITDLKGNVSINVSLSPFTLPHRTHIRDDALEDELSLVDQLFEGWRDHRCAQSTGNGDTD